jgi:hypothetical protein
MKLKALIAGAIVLTATPTFAAPQWVETDCWRYANRILPAPTAREREAYFANCIADWTAGTPPPQGRKNYNRNRYSLAVFGPSDREQAQGGLGLFRNEGPTLAYLA